MRGQLEFKGWSHFRSIKLRPGLFSNVYRNSEGWTAQEVFSGRNNRLLGLTVHDETGDSIGMVKTVQDLP